MERWMDIQKLGQLLRWMGSLLLLGASASFMLEGWHEFGSEVRYIVFFGYILVLAALGIILGLRVQEDKGARTLLGLAVAGIAAQFSQVGAMIHSMVSTDDGAIPRALLYSIGSWSVIALNTAALLVLIPVAYLGFSALNRAQARSLTIAYFAACTILLIPARHGLSLALLVIGATWFCLWFDAQYGAGTTSGSTREGAISRAMLFVPVGILLARAAFYPQPALFAGLTLFSLGVLGFDRLPRLVNDQPVQARIQSLTLVPILLGWWPLAFEVLSPLMPSLGPLMVWLSLGLVFACLSCRCMTYSVHYRKAAAVLAGVAVISQLSTHATVLTAFLCLVASLSLVISGFHYQERLVFWAGLAGSIVSLGYYLRFAIDLYAYGPWGLLAGLGLIVLLSASYLEKHATRMLGRLCLLREEMRAWH
jgi:hypothetical protein